MPKSSYESSEPLHQRETSTTLDQADFRRSLSRIIVLSFALALLVAVALVLEVDRNRIQGTWVFHSTQVLQEINAAEMTASERSRLLDQYIITGDSATRAYYAAQAHSLDDRFQGIHSIISDNELQTRRLDSITSKYWLWEAQANQHLDPAMSESDDAAAKRAILRSLDLKFSQLMVLFQNMSNAEIELRNERVAIYEGGSRIILMSIVGACLLIGIIASIFGRRQVRRLHREFARALALANRSRDQLMTALLSIGDAIVMTDKTGAIQLMNHRAESMTGWSEKSAIGKNAAQVVSIVSETDLKAHPESPVALPNPVEHALSENRQIALTNDAMLLNRRGLHIPIEASATPIQTSDHGRDGAVMVLRDISARKEREEELFHREQAFRALVEYSPDLTIRFSPDFRITFVNSRIEALLGLTPRQVIGKTFEELGVPEARSMQWTKAITAALESGEAGHMDIDYVTVRGLRQFSARFVPEIDQDGRVISIISVSRDITDAKRSERELREREEQFRGVVENSPDAFYLLSAERDENGKIFDLKFSYVNDRGAELTTFKKALLVGKRLGDIMPGDRTKAYIARCADVIETGVPQVDEYMTRSAYVANDGGSGATWLRSQFVKIGDMVSITSTDVSERKQMERSLRESEARYRRVVEGASEAIFSTDMKGRIVFANPFICKLAGYSMEDVIGLNYLEFIAPEKRLNVHRFFLRQFIEKQTTRRSEFPFVSKNGDIRWLSLTSTLRFFAPGEGEGIAGFDIIGADVTASREESDRLRKIIEDAGMEAV